MGHISILGAGIAGISAAYHAQKLGEKAVVYECSRRYGGLLDYFTIDGFRFDKAIHLSFTKDEYVRSVFDSTPYWIHLPNPYNFERGQWLKHPVQNNLFPLSVEDKIEAINSFVERPELEQANNYQEWLFQQYGEYLTARFFEKYTEKYWTASSQRLSIDWIGNRLYRPSLMEVLYGAMTDQTPNTYYAQEMRYPRHGGYKAFIEPFAGQCDIRFNKRAIFINPKLKYIQFDSGEQIYYEHLVSTIPLPELINIIEAVPAEIQHLAATLCATSVALVSIGFHRPDIPRHLWFYIYDQDILAARVYSSSLKSLDNVPAGCSSLQFEIYFSQAKPLPMNNDLLVQHCIESLESMGLAGKDDVAVADCRIVPYANVVFETGMKANKQRIIDYLRSINIHVAGRFGEWEYLWSDQSLLSGKHVIENIIRKHLKG